jgi:hypothetical protein
MVDVKRLDEGGRTKRRSIADTVDVVVRHFELPSDPLGLVRIGPLPLPSGLRAALVDVVFPQALCVVSLPRGAPNADASLAIWCS